MLSLAASVAPLQSHRDVCESRNKPITETTHGRSPRCPPAVPHLSHLVQRLRCSVSVRVGSVDQEVDQRPTVRSPGQVCFWSAAKVNERRVHDGCASSFRSNGELVQCEIHKGSLDKNTASKGKSSIFSSTVLGKHRLCLCLRWLKVWKTKEGGPDGPLVGCACTN